MSFLLRHAVHHVSGCDTHGFVRAVDMLSYVNASQYAHDNDVQFTREHLERVVEVPIRRRFSAAFREETITHVRAIQGHSIRASMGNLRILDSNLFTSITDPLRFPHTSSMRMAIMWVQSSPLI